MENNKETLRTLLEFIGDLINREGYEWFHDELSILVSKKILTENDTTIKLSAVTVKEYGSIDKYLEEGLIPMIDYSGISDHKVRLQLQRDAIEMGKVRLGYYAKEMSFIDFCKYAHFQSEELINHYFRKVFNNSLRSAISFIKKNKYIVSHLRDKKKTIDNKRSITEIPLYIRTWAITDEHNVKFISYPLGRVSDIRNNAVHRDANGKLKDIEKYNQFLLEEDYSKVYNCLLVLRDVVIEQTENMAHETN